MRFETVYRRGNLWNVWPWSKVTASGLYAQKTAISVDAVTAAAWIFP
jgi:hypothetical protein